MTDEDSPIGIREPESVASAWLESIVCQGDLASVWSMTDLPFRLARVQSWVLNHDDKPDDELAKAMASVDAPWRRPGWKVFATWSVRGWQSEWRDFHEGFTTVGIPEVVAGDIEVIRVAPGVASEGDFGVGDGHRVLRILVHHASGGWLVAGIGGIPVPGWPPTEIGLTP